jgi:nitrile hydratase beta subunit
MQGIHDLGGMDGFTLSDRDQGPILAEEWERLVWGLLFALSNPVLGVNVRDLERIPPPLYLNMPYYARWLWVQEQAALEQGLVTEAELLNPDGPLTASTNPGFEPPSPDEILTFISADRSAELDVDIPPRFSVGDTVRARNQYPAGVTRMPGYVRGRRGVIHEDRGVHPFQDTLPPGEESRLQHLYSVRFEGTELWGSQGHPRDSVYVELWGDHLERAD